MTGLLFIMTDAICWSCCVFSSQHINTLCTDLSTCISEHGVVKTCHDETALWETGRVPPGDRWSQIRSWRVKTQSLKRHPAVVCDVITRPNYCRGLEPGTLSLT